MLLSIVSAIGVNLAIGRNDQLLYHIPDDLAHFRNLTLEHPVIMGRKTYESILKKNHGEPLDRRINIVISSSNMVVPPGVHVVANLQAALNFAAIHNNEVFVIGGAQVYKEALPLADKLHLTIIHDTKVGDAYFPDYKDLFNKTSGQMNGWKGLVYEFAEFEKK